MKNIKIEWKTCFRVGISVFLLYLAITYWSGFSHFVGMAIGAASPLIIGGVIAFLVNILMSRYEKWFFPRSERKFVRRIRRPLCMTAAFITLVAVIGAVVALVIPQLVSCVKLLVDLLVAKTPEYFRVIIEFLDKHNLLSDEYLSQLANIDWKSRIGDIFKAVTSGLGSVMDVVISAVTSLFSGIVTGFISIIFSVYLLSGKERIGSQLTRLLNRFVKEVWRNRILHVAAVVNDCFRKYIVGQCTEAVILGVLCALGMWALQLPYATMIGALVAFTALIPVAGAYIGAAIGAFMILTVSPVKALIFLVFLLILQQLEGNLVYPKVVGSSLGLPGIWVLAAVIIGGGVMGVAGMLLGVPIAAAIYKLLAEQVANVPVKEAVPKPQPAPEKNKTPKPQKQPKPTDIEKPAALHTQPTAEHPQKKKKPYYHKTKKPKQQNNENDK